MRTNQLIKNEQLRKKIVSFVPLPFQRAALNILFLPRYITGENRLLPDFLMIGTQRAGSTSLYYNLTTHPDVAAAFHKEVHFFDNNYQKGYKWYKAHFQLAARKRIKNKIGQDLITGEASPFYLYHPLVPKRVFELLPDIKLVVMLRNPIDRAISQYHHERRLGYENLPFEEAINVEEQRLQGEFERLLNDEYYFSYHTFHHGYLSRSLYVDQIKRWLDYFPREQFLFICSENFYQDPPTEFERVQEFLGFRPWDFSKSQKFNKGSYSNISPQFRKQLAAYFEPFNQELYDLLGIDFGWQ